MITKYWKIVPSCVSRQIMGSTNLKLPICFRLGLSFSALHWMNYPVYKTCLESFIFVCDSGSWAAEPWMNNCRTRNLNEHSPSSLPLHHIHSCLKWHGCILLTLCFYSPAQACSTKGHWPGSQVVPGSSQITAIFLSLPCFQPVTALGF